jgi:hypothetical protein
MRPLKLRAVLEITVCPSAKLVAIARAGAAGAGQHDGTGVGERSASCLRASAWARSFRLAGATRSCTPAATLRPRSTCGGKAQVVELGAGAGADVGHVDARVGVRGQRHAVCRTVRRRELGTERGRVEVVLHIETARVRRPGRAIAVAGQGRSAGLAQPAPRHVIGCDEPGLRAELRAHVAQGHALLHRQRAHGVARELHGLVVGAVHAEARDHGQHHVLGADACGQPPGPVHGDRLRHAQPDLARDHHAEHLGAADAEHVGAERAAGGRMRVAADAEHAGPDVAVLRHHHVTDALAVIHVRQLLLARPVARDAHDAPRGLIALGHVMVHHQHDFGLVPDRGSEFLQHGLEATRPRRVVEHRQIDAAGDDLADAHRGLAGGAGNEFLGQRRAPTLPHCVWVAAPRGGAHALGRPGGVQVDFVHSGRAPENLTTFAQRVISLCTKRLNSSGLLPTGM